MAFYPVIMCGGAGTRLWPASRPSRPKQFIPLAGNRSLFQETALRVAPLAGEDGRLIVVGGVAHRVSILEQLAALKLDAVVLLEPQARDSAAAMAAAAAWAEGEDDEAVMAFVASDHHIPDDEAFRRAVRAAAPAAASGRVVTLGVRPTEASKAYGYIRPGEGADGIEGAAGVAPVAQFVEKPDRETAAGYVQAGYLWNSGNFIVSARTLTGELRQYAPGVAQAASEAVAAAAKGPARVLGDAFIHAPKISIDYAVMEKTRLASVLPVDFAWSDLGAWDAIAATGEGDFGAHIFEDAEGCMVRAPEGVLVAALGVRDLAIVVEPDAVLVCDLPRAQDVKAIVQRMAAASPRHLDFPRPAPETLEAGAERFADWMRLSALPTWATLGQREDGGFVESLGLDGRRTTAPRRARVQARQIYVFAEAGRLGWTGPWRMVVETGVRSLVERFLKADGTCRTLLDAEGAPLDETAMLYDQAFVLLALASAHAQGLGEGAEARAVALRERLLADALPNGALREAGDQPFQSNAHMHLFEACLAWEAAGADPGWAALADRIAGLARGTFIDAEGGFIREFFGEDWRPAAGEDGWLAEPGHQFEWAWLLARHAQARSDAGGLEAARRLYAFGRGGIDPLTGVAVDALNQDGSFRSRRARLWPQTEWLKAALILGGDPFGPDQEMMAEDAAAALRALWRYLTPEGLWRDKLLPNGRFLEEAAPASSFYHIAAAYGQVVQSGLAHGLS